MTGWGKKKKGVKPAAPVPVTMAADMAEAAKLEPMTSTRCPYHAAYIPTRPPKVGNDGQTCEVCWCIFNAQHDLPTGNRLPKKDYSGYQRLSRSVPFVESVYAVLGLPRGAGKLDDLTVAFQKLLRESFTLEVMSLDLSMRSAGVVLVGHIPAVFEGQAAKRWLGLPFTTGAPLPMHASDHERLTRQLTIATEIVNAFRPFKQRGPEGATPAIYLEDHIYHEQDSSRAHDMFELHGIVKSQLYLTFKRVPARVNAGTAPLHVHHSGTCRKGEARASFIAAGWDWTASLTDDEIDALTIALLHVKRHHPRGVDERLALDTAFFKHRKANGSR